jgi:adenine phosphoribosyltransferase
MTSDSLKAAIRTIPDYPKPGILFRDITTLLGDARAFRRAIDELVQPWAGTKIDKVAGMEARGFILGGAVAHQLSAGFVPIRKKGKLPHTTVGTAEGAVKLLKKLGADVLAACFVIDLPDLGGAQKIKDLGVPVRTLLAFEGH